MLSMDQLIDEYGVACPNYIKIDVPALTEAIIEGGAKTLQRREVRAVHVEADDESPEGARIVDMLTQAGFRVGARHTRGEVTDVTFEKGGGS